ncbi:MAG TPA: CapA family protein [Anaerolineales bacterium]
MKKPWLLLMLGVLVTACAPTSTTVAPTPATSTTYTRVPPTATATAGVVSLWISPAVPDALRVVAGAWGIPLVSNQNEASMTVEARTPAAAGASRWIYALVAPFPTVMDGITSQQLQAVWRGSSSEAFGKWPLLMTAPTLNAFAALWGAPGIPVRVLPEDQVVDAAWQQRPSWAIIPFESIVPRWKVLTVDGQSPVRKDFDAGKYPLEVFFSLSSKRGGTLSYVLPASNRDPQKLTTLIMTGTTSLVREIAYQMEVKGIDYPAQDIGDILRQADILHISNKTSFDPNCPPPNPNKNRFYCSDPRYIGLLDDVGVKVVELTGPHILDNGVGSLLYTLGLYQQHHMLYYGGGANLDEARKVLVIQNNGNRLAFLGCNDGEPPQPLATSHSPGANPCDYALLTSQVMQLRAQGYLPIVTFQYKEGYSPQVMPWQLNAFRKVAEAGAVIVSGSQSHVPLKMEFYDGTFIHYGLGNLFFGQMGNQPPNPGMSPQPAQRYEFLDRHVFYDNRYISTELLTAMLEDYARPRPMTPDERATFLTDYFGYSGWLPLIPTPAPLQTPTLYPLLQYLPLPTRTPAPLATPTP